MLNTSGYDKVPNSTSAAGSASFSGPNGALIIYGYSGVSFIGKKIGSHIALSPLYDVLSRIRTSKY
jgi:hypothetical protein